MAELVQIGDLAQGICNAHPAPVHFTASFATGSETVSCDGIGLVRVGDTGPTDCGHTIIAIAGSEIIKADGIELVRVGDPVAVVEGGDGVIITGCGLIKDA
jgi:uncharacterized Zn-binding protein involved in type VI secretion